MEKKRRVLIVEDVDPMRDLLEHVVQGMNRFTVSGKVANGIEARLELTRRFPDLVLLDEVLPGESSGDLLAELRELKVPVILITSLQDRQAALPEGALARVFKPEWKTADADRVRIERELLEALDGTGRNC